MATKEIRAECPVCGARLRRDRPADELCGPCQRKGPRLILPPGFYDAPPLEAALAEYDFGTVFLAIRAEQNWTQEGIGEFIGLDQNRISEIERGVRQLRDVRLVARVCTKLAIPAVKLGFHGGVTVGGGPSSGRKGVSWMERRDFVQHVGGLTLGLGAVGVDVDRLLALLPQAEPTGSRRLGAADVEVIEQITAAFRSQDFAHGSGLVRDAAVAQVHMVLPLLDAQVPAEMQPRLLLAAADLATQAGWMSFVVKEHDAARRLWMIGLDLARDAQGPRSTDLTVYLLSDMALQSVHLDRPREALNLIRVGDTAAIGRYPVSASTISLLRRIEAQAYAADGDAAGCDHALGRAAEQLSSIDPTTSPPWTAYLSEVGICGGQGSAHYTLALHGRDARAAGRSVPLLRQAVKQYGPGYAHLRCRYLPDLSGAHALAGDVDTAVAVGHEAIDLVSALSSPVSHDRLRVLNTALEPLHTSPGVAELRDRLVATAA
ncbi:MAG: helix-turn-helix domain-containing protein [Pseudonocardiaceae bacterium]